jgi:3',5'-cyclic AMP phosphodiesterase CpdA
MTDIHLSFESAEDTRGWPLAIKNAKTRGIDFIITGGDNVDIDGLEDSSQAIMRYKHFASFLEDQTVPIYPTVGNHDRCWAGNKNSSINNTGLWERFIGDPYYSFDHKGWHFIVLNSTEIDRNQYAIGKEQRKWLLNDLKKVDPQTPIVVSVHVPFLTVYYPALEGRYTAADTFR